MAGIIDKARAAVRKEAAEGVRPFVMLALLLSAIALYRTRRR